MNNTYESVFSALNNPPEAMVLMLGGHRDPKEMNERSAVKIMNERSLAIISARTECPANCIGYLDRLTARTLTFDVCFDSMMMLRGKISDEKWITLYNTFLSDGEDPANWLSGEKL